MIKINGRDFPLEESLTVSSLLKLKNYTYSRIIVKINDRIISEDEFDTALIHDGDDVKLIHLMAGG